MNIVLRNNIATAEIRKLGAELVNFRRMDNGCEYIWNGDSRYWAGHAPVLFPIVCAVYNGEIRIEREKYLIGNHGFARKSEFELIEKSELQAVFKLTYHKETLQMYPFKFELYIAYKLDLNKIEIEYQVKNVDDKDIYFQIGTHTGFNCPLNPGEKFEDYYLEFERNENLERLFMNEANVICGKSESLLRNGNKLPLTHQLFENGALVFKSIKSQKISLKSAKTKKNVILSYSNLPNLGLWQAKGAPFICIEPWYGIADSDGFIGEFKEKEMMITLNANNSFTCSLKIEIN